MRVLLLISALALVGCDISPTACEMQIVGMHEESFKRYSGVQTLNCERNRSWTLVRCSGVLQGRPVKYRCDPEGCDWECENCR